MSYPSTPGLAPPEPLRGSDPNSFASYSVTVRLAEIASRMLSDNDFRPDVEKSVHELIGEIGSGSVRALADQWAPDSHMWHRAISALLGEDWLSVPWFFAETYFYRRIMEATEYYRQGEDLGRDPFAKQKHLGLTSNLAAIRDLCASLDQWLVERSDATHLAQLLGIDLWGNQADLSLWPVGGPGDPRHGDQADQASHLIVDDSSEVLAYLTAQDSSQRVDFLIDNAGFELVCDLCLADYLLSCNVCGVVQFHLKMHPTFVSDATITDVEQTIAFLSADGNGDAGRMAARLSGHVEQGRLRLESHSFWTSPAEGWRMPDDLRDQLQGSTLTISKGDANYRRLLGDRRWHFATSFRKILGYFPAPLLALRTLKSEVMVGITASQLESLDQRDPAWMTNGRWGVIQFAP